MERNSVWESRNHKWVRDGVIDMEVHHPELGWIPYSAHQDDDDTLALFMDGVEAIGPYAGPAPDPVGPSLEELRAKTSIRKSDLLYQLHKPLGLITADDAMAAVVSGKIPPIFEPLLAKMDPDQRLFIELEFAGESRVARSWPVLESFAAAIYGSRGPAVLDALFGIGEMPNG